MTRGSWLGVAMAAAVLLTAAAGWAEEAVQTPAVQTPAVETPAAETPAVETPAAENADEVKAKYDAVMVDLLAACDRARGTHDKPLWTAVRDLADRAIATGYSDVSEAEALRLQADRNLGVLKCPVKAATARKVQQAAAATLGVPLEKTIALGGKVTLELVLIPAGEFRMGSGETPDEIVRRSHNLMERARELSKYQFPQHKVRLTRAFYMGKCEVTQEQWERVMGENPSKLKGPKNPVDQVSWNQCQEFIKKLNVLADGAGRFRLPTEAEWEYACRAGTDTPFSTGYTISTKQANYDGNTAYGIGRKGVNRGKTLPVGSFPPNAFGLYDMHGNLWEWCQDRYGHWYYKDSRQDDPPGLAVEKEDDTRVLRGGSESCDPFFLRSATRNGCRPYTDGADLGFRVVMYFSEP